MGQSSDPFEHSDFENAFVGQVALLGSISVIDVTIILENLILRPFSEPESRFST